MMCNKFGILLFVSIVFTTSLFSQGRIKVMSYNLLNFNNYTSYCTAQNNPHQAKAGYLATIVANQQPDILCCCEVGKNSSLASTIYYILGNSLNVNGVRRWSAASASGNEYLNNALFYDNTKLKLVAQTKVDTDIREINIYKLKHLYSNDTLKVAIVHLKAGTGYESQRGTEIQQLVNYLTAQGNNDNFIVCGDFNIYKASEPAFQNLVNPSYLPIAFYDPVNQMGEWNNNWNFSEYHTQSTRSGSGNDCFSGGGMDDRFDFILMSGSILNGTKGITYTPNSYWAVGQDGNRFNGAINSPQNNTLPSNVIDALYNMSDHLPVVAELTFNNVGYASESTDASFQSIVQNPANDELVVRLRTEMPREVDVNVYSALGRLVLSYSVQVADNEVVARNISDLPNGVYIVSIKSEGVSVSHRVVKAE